MLGADIRFSKGGKVGVGSSTRAMVQVVPEADLLDNGLELFCRGFILKRLGADAYGHHVEKFAWLKQELVDASYNLK